MLFSLYDRCYDTSLAPRTRAIFALGKIYEFRYASVGFIALVIIVVTAEGEEKM